MIVCLVLAFVVGKKLLDRMEKENLLVRRASPNDRRSYQVKMTVEGRKLFRKLARDHEKWVAESLAGLAEEDAEHLIELLIRVRRAFEPTVGKSAGALLS